MERGAAGDGSCAPGSLPCCTLGCLCFVLHGCGCSGAALNITFELAPGRKGDADVIVAGGSEASIIPVGLGGFVACRCVACLVGGWLIILLLLWTKGIAAAALGKSMHGRRAQSGRQEWPAAGLLAGCCTTAGMWTDALLRAGARQCLCAAQGAVAAV